MTKEYIVNEIARKHIVEEFVSNTAKTANDDLTDFCQDVYLILLKQDEEKLVGMYERNELSYFIARIICNQIRSKNSPFFTHYTKWTINRTELDYNKLKNNYDKTDDTRWMQERNVQKN